LVVEGKTDKAHISNFLECDIVTTNGSAVSCETINLIRELAKTREVVVLTDPDFPGKRIRNIINKEVPSVKNAYVPREKSSRKGKLGVAECPKEFILDALKHLTPSSNLPPGSLSMPDLMDLGLIGGSNSSGLRKKVADKFYLGDGNAKTFLSRLNALGISKEVLIEVLADVK